jgi:hypothetical protein
MQTTNGTIPTVPDIDSTPLAATRAQALARMELDGWDDALTALDLALLDAARHRATLALLEQDFSATEARMALDIEGRNEAERRARLTLALSQDAAAYALTRAMVDTRQQIHDADRRAEVARQRARLHAATVRVLTTDYRD